MRYSLLVPLFFFVSTPEILGATQSLDADKGYFSEAHRSVLVDYFAEPLIQQLESTLARAEALKTDKDFLDWYNELDALRDSLSKGFYDGQTDYMKERLSQNWYDVYDDYQRLDEIEEALFPLAVTCVAECTELDFWYHLPTLDTLAKGTKGERDDNFVSLVKMVERSDYGLPGGYGFKAWFYQTWDYGGSSLLGDEKQTHARILKMSATVEKESPEIARITQSIAEGVYSDILDWGSYMHTADKIILSIDHILKNTDVPDEIKTKLEERKEQFKHPDEHQLQLDCENTECSYG